MTGHSGRMAGQKKEENRMLKRISLVVVIALLVLPAVAQAQEGSWIFRVRGINISPNDSSSQILDTGTEVTVDSKSTVEVDLTYMFSDHVGVEVIAATARHDLATNGGALGGADAGSVKVLPPTVTLQYHFGNEAFKPYLGVGLNYTYFYSYDLSDDLAGLDITDVEFSNSFGLAGNAGLDIGFGGSWMLNFDVKYITISTDASLKVGSDTLDKIAVDIDPWVYGIGIGYRF
jgi:outer membrane protein